MERKHKVAFAVGFIVTLAFYAIGWAITVDQIWQNVYDSANTALRLIVVASS
jgi:hypothetical protein